MNDLPFATHMKVQNLLKEAERLSGDAAPLQFAHFLQRHLACAGMREQEYLMRALIHMLDRENPDSEFLRSKIANAIGGLGFQVKIERVRSPA